MLLLECTFTFTHPHDLPRRHRRHTVRRGPRVPRSFLTHHVVINISTAIHKPPRTPTPSKIANQPRAQCPRVNAASAHVPSLVWGQVRCVYSERAGTVPYILVRQLTLCPIAARSRTTEKARAGVYTHARRVHFATLRMQTGVSSSRNNLPFHKKPALLGFCLQR